MGLPVDALLLKCNSQLDVNKRYCTATWDTLYPISDLEGSDEEVDEPGDGAVLPERRVVGGAEGEVADEADDRLDERPPRRRVHQAHDGGQAALRENIQSRIRVI